MAERTLRGARLGGQSFEDERGIEFAARQQSGYRCVNGHEFEITMSVEAEVPAPVAAPAGVELPAAAPEFVRRVTAVMLAGEGDDLPVSALPIDGTYPSGTTRWEKRNIATEIPVWDEALCIQCNKCAMVCPHAAIRAKIFDPAALASAPDSFQAVDFKSKDWKGQKYRIQVAPEDCTGCTLCAMVCPAKDKSNPRHKAIDMKPQVALRE